MAKKKQQEVFIPSKYQQAIFEAIQQGVGNIVIEASAGSGKTSTLIHSLDYISSDKYILFCAFNSDIVKNLKNKIKNCENVDIRTVHSLGYAILQRNFPEKKFSINEHKYKEYVINNINRYSNYLNTTINKTQYAKYIDNIVKLINFCRYNLVDNEKDALILCDMHSIDILNDEIFVALSILEWGKQHIDTIDYTDMIWLPNVLYLKPYKSQYDYVFGDEAQDFSIAQRELILKCRNISTRFIFCGDKNQCIYSFASASPDSFEYLKKLPNTTTLPLSISYRCAPNIVKYAQTIVPSIEVNECDSRDGNIIYDVSMDAINDGDMLLCRNNAPLMEAYNLLIKKGKKCYIRGKDIGLNLKKMVKSTNQEYLNCNLQNDGVFVRLYDNFFNERNKIIQKTNLDLDSVMNMNSIANMLDMIRALEVLSEGIQTSSDLIKKIDSIFSDKKKNGISLSTIHKSKGLEAENVYIVCRSLMPSKSATKQWEIEQEKNLMYVAYTRAKNTLGFIDEKEISINKYPLNTLVTIEQKVCSILNKKTFSTTNQKNVFDKAQPQINTNLNLIPTTPTKVLSIKDKTINSLNTIINNKKKNKRKW